VCAGAGVTAKVDRCCARCLLLFDSVGGGPSRPETADDAENSQLRYDVQPEGRRGRADGSAVRFATRSVVRRVRFGVFDDEEVLGT